MTKSVSSLNFTSSWDLIGSQPTRIKLWAISVTKPALNHWSISRHRPLPPGPGWFTFMQILSFQTGFSRIQALGIGPQLLKQPVPAGCNSSNSLPPCFWVAISQAPQEDCKSFIRLTCLEAIQGNLLQILSFLICTNQTSWLFFQSRKQNWKNICPHMSSELLLRADSDPPLFSLRQQNFNVMAPPGIEPSSSAHKAKTLPWS